VYGLQGWGLLHLKKQEESRAQARIQEVLQSLSQTSTIQGNRQTHWIGFIYLEICIKIAVRPLF